MSSDDAESSAATPAGADTKALSGMIPAFLKKTYDMLEDAKLSEYIRWGQDGTSVLIAQTTGFAENVLPMFFKHRNLGSFIRQLNIYGFRKLNGADGSAEFIHPSFRRGDMAGLLTMKRRATKRKKSGSADSGPLKAVFEELNGLKQRQRMVEGHVEMLANANLKLQADNSALCREMQLSRQRQRQLQSKMRKLLVVLLNMFHSRRERQTRELTDSVSRALPAPATDTTPQVTVVEPLEDGSLPNDPSLFNFLRDETGLTFDPYELMEDDEGVGPGAGAGAGSPADGGPAAPTPSRAFSITPVSPAASGQAAKPTAAPAAAVSRAATAPSRAAAVAAFPDSAEPIVDEVDEADELRRALSGSETVDIPGVLRGKKLSDQIQSALSMLEAENGTPSKAKRARRSAAPEVVSTPHVQVMQSELAQDETALLNKLGSIEDTVASGDKDSLLKLLSGHL